MKGSKKCREESEDSQPQPPGATALEEVVAVPSERCGLLTGHWLVLFLKPEVTRVGQVKRQRSRCLCNARNKKKNSSLVETEADGH